MDYLVHPDVSEEIKSVNAIAPIHEAQLLSYLRLYETCARGLLINFNVKRLVEGIRRMKI
jgi:GxxExxY protein